MQRQNEFETYEYDYMYIRVAPVFTNTTRCINLMETHMYLTRST